MDLLRYIFGVTTLGFVLVTHLVGFNNVRVLEIFWLPELFLIIFVVYSLIPAHLFPKWYKIIKNRIEERNKKKKVIKFKKQKSIPTLAIVDGILITLIVALSLLLLYQI